MHTSLSAMLQCTRLEPVVVVPIKYRVLLQDSLTIVDLSSDVERIDLTAAADSSQITDLLSAYDKVNDDTAAIKEEVANSQDALAWEWEEAEAEAALVVEEEASTLEPDDSKPCPVCCKYISAKELDLHVNQQCLDRQVRDAAATKIALRLPSAPRPEEAVARLGRSARPRSCSTSRTTTRCRSSARSGRESAAHSKSHGTTASAFLFCAARAASTCESRCGWSRTCH